MSLRIPTLWGLTKEKKQAKQVEEQCRTMFVALKSVRAEIHTQEDASNVVIGVG
jgi:hypothetical protein